LGYLFQGIVVVLRHQFSWNKKVQEEILCKKNIVLKKQVIEHLKLDEKDLDVNLLFYLMDAELRGREKAFLPQHFSALFAFWSNMMCASGLVFLFGLMLYVCDPNCFNQTKITILLFSFPVFVICHYFANKFLKSFYDCLLNVSYVSQLTKK
jgi:hypothetical protein